MCAIIPFLLSGEKTYLNLIWQNRFVLLSNFSSRTCFSHGEKAVLDVRVRCLPSKFTFPRWRYLTRRLLEKTISLKYGWRVSGAWPPVSPWCFIVGHSWLFVFHDVSPDTVHTVVRSTNCNVRRDFFVTAEWTLGWRKTSSGQRC